MEGRSISVKRLIIPLIIISDILDSFRVTRIRSCRKDCFFYILYLNLCSFYNNNDMVAKSIGDDTNYKQLLILPFDN